MLLSIVHKGTERPLDLKIDWDDFPPAQTAEVRTLSAKVPWATNTLEAPTIVAPVTSMKKLNGTNLPLTLPPCSYTVVRIPRQSNRR